MLYPPDDLPIRLAAFSWLNEKIDLFGEVLDWSVLNEGFIWKGERVRLVGQTGIWKPRACSYPISVLTSVRGPYTDVFDYEDFLVYSYRGIDPHHSDNKSLRAAMERKLPLIYFKGISKGRYMPIFPAFILQDNPDKLCFSLQVDTRKEIIANKFNDSDSDLVRRYITSSIRVRVHQQEFRERVLNAYACKCSFCRIRHLPLLDAAHIIPDASERGEPIIVNGLSLCKIHHAAFDANLMGITPDYQIIVKKDLLEEIDGPMLKHGITELHNHKLILPRKANFHPDKDRLAFRFENFIKAS